MIEPTPLVINIKENLRIFFLEEVIGTTDKLREDGHMRDSLLILDKKTSQVLDRFVSLIDLIDYGVVSIENIDRKRKPFKQFHAIYFVEPSEDSIQKIIQDFSDDTPEERDSNGKVVIPGGARYDFAHFIFSSRVSPAILETLSKSKNVVYATLSIRQVNLDILAVDDCVFTVPVEDEKVFLNAQIEEKNTLFNDFQLLNDRATSIFTLIRKVENVQIIYQLDGAAKMFAKEFSKRTTELVHSVERVSKQEVSPIFFFVLNRGSDLLSLFARDNSYSSLYFDLLRKTKLRIELEVEADGGEPAHTVASKLDEKDNIWLTYKNDRFQDAYKSVTDRMKQFIADYAKSKNTTDLEDQVRNLPIYKEFISDFSKHVTAMKSIQEKISKEKIKDLFEIEQGLLTGFTRKGQKFDPASIKVSDDFSDFDKVRLALIGYYSGQFTKENAAKLFLGTEEDLLYAYTQLAEIYDKARVHTLDRLNVNEVADEKNEQYFQPRVVDLFFNLLKNSFWENQDIGPKFGKYDIYPKGTTIKIFDKFQFKQTGILSNKDTLPVVVIFIIGGISNCEIVALKKLASRKDLADVKLVLGGTSFNAPWWLLRNPLGEDDEDEIKARLMKERQEREERERDQNPTNDQQQAAVLPDKKEDVVKMEGTS